MLHIHTLQPCAPLSPQHAVCQIIPFHSESKCYHVSIRLPNRSCISFPPYRDRESRLRKSKKKGNNHSKWPMPEPSGVIISWEEGEEGRGKQRETQQLGTGQYLPQCLCSPLGTAHSSRLGTLHQAHTYPSSHLGAVGATSIAGEGVQMLSQHVQKIYALEQLTVPASLLEWQENLPCFPPLKHF